MNSVGRMGGLEKQTMWPSFHDDHECSSWYHLTRNHVHLIFQNKLKMTATLAAFLPFEYVISTDTRSYGLHTLKISHVV